MRGSVGQLRDNFEAQFDAAGDGQYLYRRNRKGEPIPVSAEERDRFIRQYMRRVWSVLAGMTVALLAFFAFVAFEAAVNNTEVSDLLTYVGIFAITFGAIALLYWVRGAPARELAGRASVGLERSPEEMRAIFFSKLSYGQLALAGMGGLLLPLLVKDRHDIFSGWGRLWLVLGGGLALLAAVQAFRKWRFESANDQA